MYRFEQVLRHLNKGVNVVERKNDGDSSANTLIAEWSPNNIRRLVFAYDWVVVQHFITTKKSPRLLERIDLRGRAEKDWELIRTNASQYKSPLLAITHGRVLSSLEEIIFCHSQYPPELLRMDLRPDLLMDRGTTLSTRFPRLRHISIVGFGVAEIWRYLQETKDDMTLVLDALKKDGIPIKTLVEQHQDDWWSGSALRPQYYVLDGGKLSEYFEKVKQKFEEEKKQKYLEELENKRSLSALEKHVSVFTVIPLCLQLIKDADKVFAAAPMISKAEWAYFLQRKTFFRGIRQGLGKEMDLLLAMRRVNFVKLEEYLRDKEQGEFMIQCLREYRDIVFKEIFGVEEYKRESNHDTVQDSIETLTNFTSKFFILVINIIHLSFVSYLLRNTGDYVREQYARIKDKIHPVRYTRPLVAYLNIHLGEGVPKKALEDIEAEEVLVEEFKVSQMLEQAQKILSALESTYKMSA